MLATNSRRNRKRKRPPISRGRTAFNTLLAMYRKAIFAKERQALEIAINTLGAALNIKDWDWG